MSSTPNLQATCAAVTSGSGHVFPHHPITCASKLGYETDGSMWCAHAKTEANDQRTHAAVVHSVAVLLIELASQL